MHYFLTLLLLQCKAHTVAAFFCDGSFPLGGPSPMCLTLTGFQKLLSSLVSVTLGVAMASHYFCLWGPANPLLKSQLHLFSCTSNKQFS